MRKELVIKALNHANPSRLPMVYFNGDKSKSDIILVDIVNHHLPNNSNTISEWGFQWQAIDGTMGQVTAPVIKHIENIASYIPPNPLDQKRFTTLEKMKEQYGEDRYYIASFGLSGFTIMTFLLGFSEVLEMLAFEDDRLETLADKVFNFENAVIEQLAKNGFSGVAFFDDWGTQNNLIISPALWRKFFLPRYTKQFKLAHSYGLTVYFHSCGYIESIIPDLIDSGVDFLNISQPNLYNYETIAALHGSKVCFVIPVSYQTTSIKGTKKEIWDEVDRIINSFSGHGRALIGYIEEYESIGITQNNYDIIESAFHTLGDYSKNQGIDI